MERVEITTDNVKELWELYENYLIEFRSENYSDAKPVCFEDYVYNEITYCENCGEYRTLDEMGESELALQDHICEYCMENGYGA